MKKNLYLATFITLCVSLYTTDTIATEHDIKVINTTNDTMNYVDLTYRKDGHKTNQHTKGTIQPKETQILKYYDRFKSFSARGRNIPIKGAGPCMVVIPEINLTCKDTEILTFTIKNKQKNNFYLTDQSCTPRS